MAEPIKFIRTLKGGFVLGDRVCATGDVVEVRGIFDRERSLLPIVPRVDQHRAHALIEAKLAVRDAGPARHASAEEAPAAVERAINPPRAERAQLRR